MGCRDARSRRKLVLIAVFVWVAGCLSPTPQEVLKPQSSRPTIVFLSDFGTANDSVAICKAVILGIAPDVRIMDITHRVTPYSIEEGARFLAGVTPYYPSGTIFLAVVDPGVGTSRKAVIVKTNKDQLFVLPDNGLITPVADRDGVDSAREITNPAWMMGTNISSTFHGRDVFAPAAAHLAAGEDWTLAGAEIRDLVRLSPRTATIDGSGITGAVVGLDDPYGNLITDISGDDFRALGYSPGDRIGIKIDKGFYTLPYARTFMDVPVGQPLLFIDSRGRVGVALNERDFSQRYKIAPPVPIFIPRRAK
jgi:S-adenosylmethionine hydrolase